MNNREISKATGGVEHSVICYSVNEVIKFLKFDTDYQKKVAQCIERIELKR